MTSSVYWSLLNLLFSIVIYRREKIIDWLENETWLKITNKIFLGELCIRVNILGILELIYPRMLGLSVMADLKN